MPMSCKCILDRMVHKGAMTEKERDKILRNLKSRIERLIDEMVQNAEKNMVGASLDGVYIFATNLKTRLTEDSQDDQD